MHGSNYEVLNRGSLGVTYGDSRTCLARAWVPRLWSLPLLVLAMIAADHRHAEGFAGCLGNIQIPQIGVFCLDLSQSCQSSVCIV